MNYQKQIKLAAYLTIAFFLQGCAIKNNNGVVTPKTPQQWVTVYNAALAKANNAAVQTAIALQKQGIISEPQTKAVLEINKKVAVASEAVRTAVSSTDWTAGSAAVVNALNTLGIEKLIPQVNNAELQTALTSIKSLIDLIRAEVKQ